ncbi:MAG: chemotaxis protein CheA [Gammaproteobacteria bacterium]|nr:chemotaxis protein CheA [Gammaproteobacteria bacterium]
MGIDLSQFHATFLEESFEGLDVMESSLLNLDAGDSDSETVNTIFRSAHSIKGGSATFGFDNVAKFTHVLETLLDEVRSEEREVTQSIVNALLESVDCVRSMLEAQRDESDYDEAQVKSVQDRLEAILGNSGSVAEETVDEVVSSGSTNNSEGWLIDFKPHLNMIQTGNDPVRIIREIKSLGLLEVKTSFDKLPDLSEMNAEDCYLSWEIELYSDVDESVVREIFEWVEDECDLVISPLSSEIKTEETSPVEEMLTATEVAPVQTQQNPEPVVEPEIKKAVKKRTKPVGENASIRVGIDKVDELINLVGELVITQSMLGEMGRNFDPSNIEKMMDGLAQLERHTRELQESVMRIRMLPISFAFNRFPRLVHDLSSKLGKKIELKLSGEATELDKTVMEKIGDPLVHLVRNSLDHGLETPDIRKAAGKPETGVLHLNAYHKGGSIIIEISDDGAGLNKEKIRSKAVSSGLIAEDEILTDEKIYDLIFQPGFSTAEAVSDLSGRGVGMDVVRRNIRELGGAVDIVSKEGEGSKITIRLPLTLAIMDGQLVRVGNETYIIPIVSIIESLQAKKESINKIVDQAEVYKLRDEYINIVRLYEIFDLQPETTDVTNGLLVMVEGEGSKIGLFVDELLGQQQVVIKSLETNYRRIEGVSGATILGDGTVAMILDVPGLVVMSRAKSSVNEDKVA